MALKPGNFPLLPRRRLPSCRWLRQDTDQLTVTPEGTRTSSFFEKDPRVTSFILVSEQFPVVRLPLSITVQACLWQDWKTLPNQEVSRRDG